MNKIISLKTLAITAICIGSVVGVSNAQGSIKTEKNIRANHKAQTVIFKVKPQYQGYCSNTKIDDPQLIEVFNKLGMPVYSKLFPRAQRPETEFNQNHDRLVDLSLIYELHYNADVSVAAAINLLMQTGKVVYADPHYIHSVNYNPNDPSLGQQYFLTNINAFNAWNVNQGDTNVVIGIVDSGTDPNHPDLAGNLKHNYADPVNGIDDDNDGYVDNFSGWDVSENDNDATVGLTDHGSHVSGCAAAVTDNNTGVASSGFKCKFLPVKASLDNTVSSIDNGYESIVYAADHGANIINCSWGGAGGGAFGQDVINYAVFNKNVTVIVSAGNSNDEAVTFPSSYENVFAIASTSSNDGKSGFSSFGSFVDMCAPGSNIYSTVYNNSYTNMSGTSMASPIAAGGAGLIKAQFPNFTALQVGEQLRVTSDNIYAVSGNGTYANKLGSGRINLFKALTVTSPSVRFINRQTYDGNDNAFVSGDTIRLAGVYKNFLSPTTNLVATLSTTNPFVTIINNTNTLGAIGTLDSLDNFLNPFTIRVKPTAPINTTVLFKITYSDGTYNDFEILYIPVNVDYINVAINKVGLTVTSKGRLGWNNDSQQGGIGFTYNGSNLMYDGGLMIGTSASKVSDVIRGTGGNANDADFQSVSRVTQIVPAVKSDFDTYGRFNDVPAASPINLLVTHRSYAWANTGDDKYVIVEFTIKNSGTTAQSNLYAGLGFDWDIMDYTMNKTNEDISLGLGYAYSTQASGLYAGVKVLTSGGFNHYGIDNIAGGAGGIDIANGFTTAQKYTTLSTARANAGVTGAGNDVLDVVSTGPYSINAGDSIIVAFAVIAGDELTDLTTSAVNAQIKYDGITAVSSIGTAGFSGISFQPNPASNFAVLNFQLSRLALVNVSLYNSMGAKVDQLSGNYAAGKQTIKFDTSKLSAGVYHAVVNSETNSQTVKLIIQK